MKNPIKRLFIRYKADQIKTRTQYKFNNTVWDCANISAVNNSLAFAVHKKGVFGYPVVELIKRPENVCLDELDNVVIVKDGYVYEMTKRF